MDSLILLPQPRRVTRTEGFLCLDDSKLILLQSRAPQMLHSTARRVQKVLQQHAAIRLEVTAGSTTPPALVGLTLRLDEAPDGVHDEQGYRLSIRPDGITVQASHAAGLFYGACTLAQIIEQAGATLPCLEIVDWPDFSARGVMLDVSRNKVPTMETLYGLVEMLAGWKINQVQLYTEHTFAYQNHPDIWASASPLTGQEMLELDEYCRHRYIDLVPNQNSFGHLDRWLRHPRYMPLAEFCGEIQVPGAGGRFNFRGPFSLCPLDARSIELLRSMYDELLPHFSSRLFNVGCDETWDLGQGRSRDACRQHGAAQVYLDFLLKVKAEVQARGRTMQFWGDIVTQQPELLPPELQDSIALEWGYEATHPFDEHSKHFTQAGIPFYVCPGTSSWLSIAGRTDNALANLRCAAENGLRHGAVGYLITDWGDRGHWQALPISYLGFAAGAAFSWGLEANRALDIARAVSWHAFRDATGNMGRVVYDLGNVYRAAGVEPENSSALFHFFADPFAKLRSYEEYRGITAADFYCAHEAISTALAPLASARPGAGDAMLVRRELGLTERMLRHACRRGLLFLEGDTERAGLWRSTLRQDMQSIIASYQAGWLARNRPGGLADSVARLERVRDDYGAQSAGLSFRY